MAQKAAIQVQVQRLMYRKCKVSVSVLLSQIFISKYLYRYQFLKGDMGASLLSSGWTVHVMIVLVRFVSAQATRYRLLLVPLNHLNGNVRSLAHDYLECLHRQAYWLPLKD